MIEFNCPECGRSIKVSPKNAGKTGRCTDCRTRIEIPLAAESGVEILSYPNQHRISVKKKRTGCLAVLLWLMAGYFYLNAAFCMMKGLDDPTGAFVGGAVLSLVMALLFSFMATKT